MVIQSFIASCTYIRTYARTCCEHTFPLDILAYLAVCISVSFQSSLLKLPSCTYVRMYVHCIYCRLLKLFSPLHAYLCAHEIES